MMKMTLEEAIERLTEIATGDKERDALETLVFACEAYRSTAEGLQKRLALYRGMSACPDLPCNASMEEGVMKDKYRIDENGEGVDGNA